MAFKTYSTESAARAAIRKAGLHLCSVEYHMIKGKVEPSVGVELLEDKIYIEGEKGFKAHIVKASD